MLALLGVVTILLLLGLIVSGGTSPVVASLAAGFGLDTSKFVALGGGVTRSLRLDAHGKSLASAILDLDIDDPGSRHERPEPSAQCGHARPPITFSRSMTSSNSSLV